AGPIPSILTPDSWLLAPSYRLESRNLRYGFRIEAREKLHQQVDGAVEISPFDHAVVAVQIARGHGEIDGRRSRGVALQFRRVLGAACSDFGLEGDVRVRGDTLEEVAQPQVHQHRSVGKINHGTGAQPLLRPIGPTARMVGGDAGLERNAEVGLDGQGGGMRSAQAYFFLD